MVLGLPVERELVDVRFCSVERVDSVESAVIALRRCEVAVRVAGRSADPKGLWTLVLAFAVVDGPSFLVLVLCRIASPGAGCAPSEMVKVPSIWL
jgi:hypothetical protein